MEVKLTGKYGDTALVSPEDYDRVNQYSWHQNKKGYVSGYVNGKSLKLHHFIMNAERGQLVDHINHIRQDNRKENLRFYTYQLNGKNRTISKSKQSSKYRGIFYNKPLEKYIAQLTYNKKWIVIGSFKTEMDAVDAFDMYIIHNKLEGIEPNFPNKLQEYERENI